MKIFVIILALVATLGAVAIIVPAPTRALLPFTVAAPELSPWLVIFNVYGLLVAAWALRPAIPIFAIALVAALWPVSQIGVVQRSIQRQLGVAPGSIFLASLKGVKIVKLQPQILPLNIRLYSTAAPGPKPILIDLYGGAWQRGEPTDDSNFANYMAARGYAVFAIDYRHAPTAQFPAQIDDVNAAITFIHGNAKQYGVDPTRIALCGRSAGGQLALLAAYTQTAVPIKAVIGFYPPVDLALGYVDLPSPDPLDARSILETYLGGPPTQVPEKYRVASPITYADRKQPPTLLLQGARDHIVKPGFARALFRKLKAAGNQAYLVEIPWAEHAFDAVYFGPGNLLALSAVEPFLREQMR